MRWSLGGAIGAMLAGSAKQLGAAPLISSDPWLDTLATRKHKVFLDVGLFGTDGGAFRRSKALMTVFNQTYGAPDGDIGIAFGAHSTGLGYVLTPAAWDKLGLVEQIAGGNLRSAEVAALRNGTRNWGSIGAENVPALQARGVKFLACRNTITRWADGIARRRGTGTGAEVTAEIIAGLHPGVEVVPAMIAAAAVAQPRGLSYIAIN
jgi:intracellular sulfur oxidation DsrE/DsrF family protein